MVVDIDLTVTERAMMREAIGVALRARRRALIFGQCERSESSRVHACLASVRPSVRFFLRSIVQLAGWLRAPCGWACGGGADV